VTKLTHRLAFRDKAGRDHMTKYDGFEASYDYVDDLLRSLPDPANGPWSGLAPVEAGTSSVEYGRAFFENYLVIGNPGIA
jgi:hypothetical protein